MAISYGAPTDEVQSTINKEEQGVAPVAIKDGKDDLEASEWRYRHYGHGFGHYGRGFGGYGGYGYGYPSYYGTVLKFSFKDLFTSNFSLGGWRRHGYGGYGGYYGGYGGYGGWGGYGYYG